MTSADGDEMFTDNPYSDVPTFFNIEVGTTIWPVEKPFHLVYVYYRWECKYWYSHLFMFHKAKV